MAEKWIVVIEVDDTWDTESIVDDLTNRDTDIRVVNVRRTFDSPTTTHACAECEWVHLPRGGPDILLVGDPVTLDAIS